MARRVGIGEWDGRGGAWAEGMQLDWPGEAEGGGARRGRGLLQQRRWPTWRLQVRCRSVEASLPRTRSAPLPTRVSSSRCRPVLHEHLPPRGPRGSAPHLRSSSPRPQQRAFVEGERLETFGPCIGEGGVCARGSSPGELGWPEVDEGVAFWKPGASVEVWRRVGALCAGLGQSCQGGGARGWGPPAREQGCPLHP